MSSVRLRLRLSVKCWRLRGREQSDGQVIYSNNVRAVVQSLSSSRIGATSRQSLYRNSRLRLSVITVQSRVSQHASSSSEHQSLCQRHNEYSTRKKYDKMFQSFNQTNKPYFRQKLSQ